MNRVDIYVSECVKHLPKKHRKDVALELQSEITSMIEEVEQAGVEQNKAVEQVLNDMGNPKRLADQYLNRKAYLIGPRYYPTYLRLLRIVILSVFIGLTVAYLVGVVFDNGVTAMGFIQYLVGLFNAGLQIFAWITVIFTLIERNEKPLDDKIDTETWSVKDLPKSIDYKQKSNRIEGIAGLVFITLLLILFNFEFNLLGVYLFKDGQLSDLIPIFNADTMNQWLPWFNGIFALSIISNIIKAASIHRSKKMEYFLISLSIISLVAFIWVFVNVDLFNPNLAQMVAPNNDAFAVMWQNLTSSVIWVVSIIVLIDIFTRVYKLLKV